MNRFLNDVKWWLLSGLTIWFLVFLFGFNTIYLLKILNGIIEEIVLKDIIILQTTIIAVILIVALYLVFRRKIAHGINKIMKKNIFILPLIVLTIILTLPWILNYSFHILSFEQVLKILYYTIIFTTGFTIKAMILSTYFYRRWKH